MEAYFKKVTVGTLIFTLILFFSMCCCLPASMAHKETASAMVTMPSMSAEVKISHLPQHSEIKSFLTDVHDCRQCKCRNVIASLNEGKLKILQRSFFVFKVEYFNSFVTNGFNLNTRLAFHDLSPPKASRYSVPIFLFIRVLRL